VRVLLIKSSFHPGTNKNDAVPNRDAALHCLPPPHERFPVPAGTRDPATYESGWGFKPEPVREPEPERAAPEPEASTHLSLPRGSASPTCVPRRRPCPPLPCQQPAAGAHSSRAPRTPRLRSPR
jgi:hypothetical protein